MSTAALFTIAKTWKQPKCPMTEEWIKKPWYVYITEYYSAQKRQKLLNQVNNIDEISVILSKRRLIKKRIDSNQVKNLTQTHRNIPTNTNT